jgi:hypothetical protein
MNDTTNEKSAILAGMVQAVISDDWSLWWNLLALYEEAQV